MSADGQRRSSLVDYPSLYIPSNILAWSRSNARTAFDRHPVGDGLATPRYQA
jgi:hypothetical protein